MMLSGRDVPNGMIEKYIRLIRHSRESPTLATDKARMDMHSAIIESAHTTRHDHAFLGALSDAVYDLI